MSPPLASQQEARMLKSRFHFHWIGLQCSSQSNLNLNLSKRRFEGTCPLVSNTFLVGASKPVYMQYMALKKLTTLCQDGSPWTEHWGFLEDLYTWSGDCRGFDEKLTMLYYLRFNQVIWEKFGWVGKDVHAIISQIAESGLPKWNPSELKPIHVKLKKNPSELKPM